MTTLDQRRALALRIAKTIQRDPASIVASLRARLDETAFDFRKGQPRDYHGRWTDKPGGGGGFIKKIAGKFAPSEQEEFDKLEKKLKTTGHLQGKEATRHNALRDKIHGKSPVSHDEGDDGPTHADNLARERELQRRLEGDEGLSGKEAEELASLQRLNSGQFDEGDDYDNPYDGMEDFVPSKTPFYEQGKSKTMEKLEREEESVLHSNKPYNRETDSGLTKQELADIDEYTRLMQKLEESYLTDAEADRYDELRLKIDHEGPNYDD